MTIQNGKFSSWEIKNDTLAIKTCDKSFFNHNGSSIPVDVEPFFGAETIAQGESKQIILIFQEQEYEARLTREKLNLNRLRIFWHTDLGSIFNKICLDIKDNQAYFEKIAEDRYVVTIKHKSDELEKDGTMIKYDEIQEIKSYIASKGFEYEEGMIENFYLSLKSKPFVILAGTSGTGKTRLVRLFAEAVGATALNGQYKMVPVRPDWSDSSDLFGHIDLSGKFIPGEIIDFIKLAETNHENPYFLCLDEMNLARVEYYLSDILSVIETRDWKSNGQIITTPLISPLNYGNDEIAKQKYGLVTFPENLYIIGTVNMDETTFPFSRKVLDRANTIEFSTVNLVPDFTLSSNLEQPQELLNEFFKTQYLILTDCQDEAETVQQYCVELQKINQILKRGNAHVGYRVRDEIVFYLLNNKETKLLTQEKAFDNEIMQKILPRIQGSNMSIKRMLCDLFKYCAGEFDGYQTGDNDISSKMFKKLKSNDNTVLYKKSSEKIAFMVRRYEEDGFTSYWL